MKVEDLVNEYVKTHKEAESGIERARKELKSEPKRPVI